MRKAFYLNIVLLAISCISFSQPKVQNLLTDNLNNPIGIGTAQPQFSWQMVSDGEKPDSTFENPGMNSFNHFAYVAIRDWMYRKMVGIDTYEDGVGYKHIKIKPHIGGYFTYASASIDTYYGKVSNSWKIENGNLLMDEEIPANTAATVFVPDSEASNVTESKKALSQINGTKVTSTQGGYVVLQLGSGEYDFAVSKTSKQMWDIIKMKLIDIKL
ncbi:MAG: alpha-L-rhamnosidase C-terminal domain-containing protein [Ginsengibacter sp.]